MQKTETLLNEKLLRLGNPNFWGKNFHIQTKGGSPIDGILVRVNWTMRYGKVIGSLTIKLNASERIIDLDDVTDISQFSPAEAPKPVTLVKEEPRKEVKAFIPERKVDTSKKVETAEVTI